MCGGQGANHEGRHKSAGVVQAGVSRPVGTTVTWVNHDEEPHTVTSGTGAFSSAGLVNDDTFVRTFTKPGTYQYFCAIHPYMKGTLVGK